MRERLSPPAATGAPVVSQRETAAAARDRRELGRRCQSGRVKQRAGVGNPGPRPILARISHRETVAVPALRLATGWRIG
jgi:hypothetical protein